MSRSKLLFSMVAVPLLALLIACGGGDKKDNSSGSSGDSSSSSSQGSGSTGSGSSGANNSNSSSSSSDANLSLENCKEYTNLEALATAGFGTSSSNGQLKIDKDALSKLVKASPSEIRGDVQTVVDAVVSFYDTLTKLGVNPNDPSSFAKLDQTKLAQMQEAVSKFDTDKIQQAGDRIEAYFTKHCS